jgi:hypothetical protein
MARRFPDCEPLEPQLLGGAAVSLVFGLEFSQPRRNSGKDVRLLTMRAAQLSSVARQTGEARRVHVNPRVDYIAGRGGT